MANFHHFALSEVVLVITAIWCVVKFTRAHLYFAAVGTFILGLTALIGSVRFGFGEIESMAVVHKTASMVGGVIAVTLIASQFVLANFQPTRRKTVGRLLVLTALASCLGAVMISGAGTIVFVVWSLVGSIWAFSALKGPLWSRCLIAVAVSGLLLDQLFVSQSPVLGPNLSWHLYHLIIAVWLVFLWKILNGIQRQRQDLVP